MTRTLVLSLAGAAMAAFLAFGMAQASPATGTLDSMKSVGTAQSTVEQTSYYCRRHCWWHHGHRHCRRHCGWWW